MIFTKRRILNLLSDAVIYGNATIKIGVRKWYNPLRWIKGPHYLTRIKPADIWRKA